MNSKGEACKNPKVEEGQGESTCKEDESTSTEEQCWKITSKKKLKKTATEDESTDAGDEGNTKKRELAAARRIDCVGDTAAATRETKNRSNYCSNTDDEG